MTFSPDIPLPRVLQEIGARSAPDRGFTFVGDDGVTEEYYAFADLAESVGQHARAFQRMGLQPGERVAMIIPEGRRFVLNFLGAMHAGLVPVPMCPPATLGKLTNYLDASRHLISRSEARALICTQDVQKVVGSLADSGVRHLLNTEQLPIDREVAPLADLDASSLAFVQFTSGSTSRPKGVMLSHGNLSANAHCIMTLGLQATPEDRGCTWLPFYHDMGLIGFVLAPLTTETPVAFMPPLAFLKRPVQWLRMITRHRGSIGFSPNFGYGLCTSRIREADLQGLDLSSWRIAGCGAEPIQRATLQAFCDRFAPVGFRPEAMMPCYGMAESTLAVSFHRLDEPVRAVQVNLDTLTREQRVAPVASSERCEKAEFVCCGRPFPGHELGIGGPDGHLLAEGEVGEILLRGPSVMNGYYNDPAATSEALRSGWLHTGDRGYLLDGELYVCGRIKDMIIVAGRNYYPTDIEWAAGEVSGIRRGNVVAFGHGRFGEQERVVVAAEWRQEPEDPAALQRAVQSAVLEDVGVRVDEVLLLAPGSLPKTTSGKLQRNRTRQMYDDGSLQHAHRTEGRIDLARHLLSSGWGLLKHRVRSTLTQGIERIQR